MENVENAGPNGVNRSESRVEDLHLDRVVASQPEIGPAPPDGGYGWLIVVSAVIYHVTVPGLLTLYGFAMLMAFKEEDHEEGEVLRLWDVDIALVPILMVVIRLLVESWCRAVVKVFHMPRFMALSGLCLSVAGVLLSSYAADPRSNDHIINIFSGIFIGIGCALTGQQTEVILTHYFREKLTLVQRLVRMAPSAGNALTPVFVGYLCTLHSNSEVVIMIYGAVMMQNCLFLASYTRPIYIEKVIRSTYNRLRDAVEDEDEVIFSNNPKRENSSNEQENQNEAQINNVQNNEATTQDEDDVVVFKSNKNAKEILDPAVQMRENTRAANNEARFSSDFSTMFDENPSSSRFSSDFGGANRFSSDFGSLDITSYSRINAYQELESIDREVQNPQPLYRGTTVDAPSTVVFGSEVTPGTARRTASLKKNLITIKNMLIDVNFYLYALLHLSTTFSILILGVVFPTMLWEENPSMTIWSVSIGTSMSHCAALCFILMCIALPNTINQKARIGCLLCLVAAISFFGLTLFSHKSFLIIWCMTASFATSACHVLQQPLYSALNEFDTTATLTAANTIAAIFIMAWSLAYSYDFKTCFFTASVLQTFTAGVFFAFSFRRRGATSF